MTTVHQGIEVSLDTRVSDGANILTARNDTGRLQWAHSEALALEYGVAVAWAAHYQRTIWLVCGEILPDGRTDWTLTSVDHDSALSLGAGGHSPAAVASATALLTGTVSTHAVAREISEGLHWAQDRALAFARHTANESAARPDRYCAAFDRFTRDAGTALMDRARNMCRDQRRP